MLDCQHVTDVVSGLVKIESINPELLSGGSGEAQIARYVVDFLNTAGLEARLEEVSPGRFNAIGILRGRAGGRSLMFNGHLDTVGVAGMADPFSARVEDGRLYGRGAQDMKGGVAAALVAAATLAKERPLKGDVVVAAVADEEHKSLGTRALLEEVKTDAAIVMEPTGLEVGTAHKGFVWTEIETQGRAAHGSRPEEGLDAIAFMGRVLVEIEKLQEELKAGPRHPLLGCGSVHASLISGGQELSSYPERCQLSLERRLLPGEDAATFERELGAVISRLSKQDARLRARYALVYAAEATRQLVSTLALALHMIRRVPRHFRKPLQPESQLSLDYISRVCPFRDTCFGFPQLRCIRCHRRPKGFDNGLKTRRLAGSTGPD